MLKTTYNMPRLLRRHLLYGLCYFQRWRGHEYHFATNESYLEAAPIPLPSNVDAAETTRFSPHRSRDISSTVIPVKASILSIDIPTDNTYSTILSGSINSQDPHVQSYDCIGLISLNSAMQSNVPTPFGGINKFSHLNMPGGQWSQEYKFIAQNLHNSHYSALRDSYRAGWVTYDQKAFLGCKSRGNFTQRSYSSKSTPLSPPTETPGPAKSASTNTSKDLKLSNKERLKQAFKEYGASIVAFHVGISIISLGGFYVLVYSGINLVPVLQFLGISSPAIAEKIATGSTFVVAYAVHKVFAPARISITLTALPFIIRYFRSKRP